MPLLRPPVPTTAAARLVGSLALGGLTLWGCAGGEATTAGTPPATEVCDAVEFPPVQFGSHLIGDAEPPVPYSSIPPSSGWHLAGAPTTGVATEPLSEPAQVSTLEAGGVVVTYNGLDADGLEVLADRAAAHPRTVALTSYDRIDEGAVVFSSWGAQQRCDGVDVEALEAFVAAYGGDVTTFEEES